MPFKKGESGNPAKRFSKANQPANPGRPKKLPELEILIAEALEAKADKGKTIAKQVIEALVSKALSGDLRAIELLFNRAYGKPKEQIDYTSGGKEFKSPATIVFVQGEPEE